MNQVYDTATPYIASYAVLRKERTVAFVLRSNTSWMNNYYGLPAGKVEQDESYTAAAVREAKEEVGIDVAPDTLRHALTVHRKSRDGKFWVDVYFEVANYQGEAYNAEPHMHSELAWLDIDNLPENVIPSVRAALEHIAAGDTYAEYGWDGQGED